MYGSINLNNPNDFKFDPHFLNDHLEASLKQAYRPQQVDNERYMAHVIGTLVGLYQGSGLLQKDLKGVLEQFTKYNIRDFVNRLEGLFFLYIYDKKNSQHFLINNRYQLTKLYYRIENKRLDFASSLKPLVKNQNKVQPQYGAIYNFLANGFNISDQTQVEGIRKLLPSFWISVGPEGLNIDNSWKDQLQFDRKPFKNLESHLDTYENLYRETLENYLNVRKPDELATLLSGGHDTSFALIKSSQIFDKPVHAFTTIFPRWAFNEEAYARNICEKFGGHFHPVEFKSKDLDIIVDMIRATEEPVLGSTLPLHILAKEASQYTDTILGGDGGDTLWAEYFPVGEYHRWVKDLPLFVRKVLHKASKGLRDLTDWERFWELEHVAGLFAQNDYYDNFMSKLCTYRHFTPKYLVELFAPHLKDTTWVRSTLEIPFTRENFDDALIEGKLYNAFYTYQSFQQTRSMNSFGMEFYLPTVNREVMRFITNLPRNWVNGGTTFHRLINSKKVNRKFHKFALARYLKREEIYNRSFDIPWFRIIKPRKHLLNLLLKRLKKRGWYDDKALDSLFNQFIHQRDKDYELLELKSHGYRILALLSLEVWAIEFLDGAPNESGVILEDYLNQSI